MKFQLSRREYAELKTWIFQPVDQWLMNLRDIHWRLGKLIDGMETWRDGVEEFLKRMGK